MQNSESSRLTLGPLALMRQAVGDPSQLLGKSRRFAQILHAYTQGDALEQKLQRLTARGHMQRAPNKVQLAVGAYDMLRFWISPASADYYQRKNISFGFHQVLRFLDEPASLADPVGFFSTRDGIIGHLMQVVHANPVYDLQLLDLYEDGLDELELQLEQMLNHTHPRSESIGAIVEEPEYHAKLLAFVRAWRADPSIAPMLRSNVAEKKELALLEQTFGSLTCAMAYFCEMPGDAIGAMAHLRTVSQFPEYIARDALEKVKLWRALGGGAHRAL